MKIKIFLCILITMMLMGCVKDVENNNETEQKSDNPVESEMKLSELYNWNDAFIKIIDTFPRFQMGLVVQDEKDVFFSTDGNKIVRINKKSRDKKIIREFNKSEDEEVGVHFCLGNDKIFIEYEGDIFSSDFDGENMVKIISWSKLKKSISIILSEKPDDYGDFSSMQFYKNNLYLFSNLNIFKLDLVTRKITLIAEDTTSACFFDDSLYYSGYSNTVIYKMKLSTKKRKRVRGKETIVSSENSDTIKYYDSLIVVDNQMYYVLAPNNNKSPVIYQYCEDRKDKKIYEYPIESWRIIETNTDSTKIVCEYIGDDANEKRGLIIYDIKYAVANEIDVPDDFDFVEFFVGDMIFYRKKDSDDEYLSCFKCKF